MDGPEVKTGAGSRDEPYNGLRRSPVAGGEQEPIRTQDVYTQRRPVNQAPWRTRQRTEPASYFRSAWTSSSPPRPLPGCSHGHAASAETWRNRQEGSQSESRECATEHRSGALPHHRDEGEEGCQDDHEEQDQHDHQTQFTIIIQRNNCGRRERERSACSPPPYVHM